MTTTLLASPPPDDNEFQRYLNDNVSQSQQVNPALLPNDKPPRENVSASDLMAAKPDPNRESLGALHSPQQTILHSHGNSPAPTVSTAAPRPYLHVGETSPRLDAYEAAEGSS